MILHYITANYMVDPSVVIPLKSGIHAYQLAYEPMVWHGYRSSAVWQRIGFCKKSFLFNV